MIVLLLAGCFVTDADLDAWADQDGDGLVRADLGGPDCDDTTADIGRRSVTSYADADADGFGDAAVTTLDCAVPDGFSADATDCDDADATVHPGAAEVCDGVDQDCDDAIDEDATDAPTFYADTDEDGLGDPDAPAVACDAPTGHVENPDDCDDTSPATGGPSAHYPDADGDGFGVESEDPVVGCDWVDGYATLYGDCNDGDPTIHPEALEVSDAGIDDDCDGEPYDARIDEVGTLLLGDYPGGRLGPAAGVGDVRGGLGDEVFVGLPGVDGGGVRMAIGRARQGPNEQLDAIELDDAVTWWTGEPGDEGGTALLSADFDGDGALDLVVGAPGAQAEGGVAHVFQSGFDFGGLTPDLSLDGEADGDRIGTVLGAGDVDLDGLPDLLLSTVVSEKVYVVPGGFPFSGDLWATASGGMLFVGPEGVDADAGSALAVGNVDGNGLVDVVIGAPGTDATADAGTVWICLDVMGGDEALAGQRIDLADECHLVAGAAQRDGFGAAVALVDLDADDVDDVLVGAPGTDGDYAPDVGAVYGFGGGSRVPDLADAGDARWTFLGEEPTGGAGGGRAGATLLATGDIDHGSGPDFAVGAPDWAQAAPPTGAVYFVFGPVDSGSRSLSLANDRFGCQSGACGAGSSLATADFDGDLTIDTLVGAPGWVYDTGVVSGATAVVYGSAIY